MIILADGREVCVPCIQGTRATIKYYYIDQAGNVHIDFNNHPSIVIPRKPIEITKTHQHTNHQSYNHQHQDFNGGYNNYHNHYKGQHDFNGQHSHHGVNNFVGHQGNAGHQHYSHYENYTHSQYDHGQAHANYAHQAVQHQAYNRHVSYHGYGYTMTEAMAQYRDVVTKRYALPETGETTSLSLAYLMTLVGSILLLSAFRRKNVK